MAPLLIFDRLLLRARRQRGLRLGPATFLLDQVAEEFVNRLRLVLRRFDLAVDLGTPTAAVRTALLRDDAIGSMIALDPMIAPQQAGSLVAGQTADAFAITNDGHVLVDVSTWSGDLYVVPAKPGAKL